MALRALLLGGLALAVVANAWLQWRGAPPDERRAPLAIALAFASVALPAACVVLLDALTLAPLSTAAYGLLAFGVFGAAVALGAIAAHLPWRRVWPFALGLVAALALAFILPGRIIPPYYASLALLFALSAPRAVAAAWAARGAFGLLGAGALGGLLGFAGLAGTLILLLGVGAGGFGDPAVHVIRVEVVPDTGAPYELRVPLVEADSSRGREALDLLLEEARVVQGAASARVAGGILIVEGSGPATVELRRAFFGPGREAFSDWSLVEAPLRIEGNAANVNLGVDFSGGTGHTCWARGEWSARAEPGGASTFRVDERGLPTVCA